MRRYLAKFTKVALVALVFTGCATTQKIALRQDDLGEKIELLAQEISSSAQRRMRIAVVEFTDIRGESNNLGKILSEKLTAELHNTGRFVILEREKARLHKMLDELNFSLSDLIDESSARRLGRQLAAEAILTGIMADMGNCVDINARLIEVETGAIIATAQVQIAKSETVRNLLGPQRENLRLSMNIIAEREAGRGYYQEVLVEEGGVLKSGDTFKVHFGTNEDCYVYVFIYDSQGRIQRLFPDVKGDSHRKISAEREYAVPAENLWFELDANPGIETIYILASYDPLKEVGKLFSQLVKGNLGRRINDFGGWGREIHTFSEGDMAVRIPITVRGVKGVVKGKSVTYHLDDGTGVQKESEVIEGGHFVARAISFVHK